MKIVLFGQKWLAVEVLRGLSRLPGVEIVAVCPDTEQDRLVDEARQRGIPIAGMSAVPACDMAVAAYCQRFIPASVRARCSLGVRTRYQFASQLTFFTAFSSGSSIRVTIGSLYISANLPISSSLWGIPA